MTPFNLLSIVEHGGCSAKLPASELSKVLSDLPRTLHPNLLVGNETHDDAGVYKINDDLAIIQTTDFFPPVCSDPYEFGQIAAANALSDVYAMGGEVLSVLNIVTFPDNVPLEVLKEILRGGIEKVKEANGVIMGGHTIVDAIPKYGLAVTGTIHPDKIITNNTAKAGDVLILTKPIGVGIIMAGHRIGEADDLQLRTAMESMKQLNKNAVPIMQKHKVKCATDITGFGLLGHALKMAMGSNVTLKIKANRVPVFDGVLDLLELGCIPGACFKNLDYVEKHCQFEHTLDYNLKMLLLDAQTSGGLLICGPKLHADEIIEALHQAGYPYSNIIGEVCKKENMFITIL